MNKRILVFSADDAQGKTTLAKGLAEWVNDASEGSAVVISFGTEVREELIKFGKATRADIYRKPMEPYFRQLMNHHGDLKRLSRGENYWADKVIDSIYSTDAHFIFIDDLRFKPGFYALKQEGAKIVFLGDALEKHDLVFIKENCDRHIKAFPSLEMGKSLVKMMLRGEL